MRLKFKREGNYFSVVDLDRTVPVTRYEWPDGTTTRQMPLVVGSMVAYYAGPCCGVKEFHRFMLEKGSAKYKKEVADLLVKETLKAIKNDKEFSYLHAFFLKVGKEKQYRHHHIMNAMEKHGWKKTAKPFMNRRYPKSRPHWLQPLLYIVQSNKKGNQI
jgi:hypothetical protein